MKKIIVLILALTFILTAFACTKTENEKPVTTDPNVTTPGVTPPVTTPEITTTEDKTTPDLPDITFNGAKYRVSTRANALSYEVFADETATDIRQQALWERNEAVEDKYGVTIEPIVNQGGGFYDHVTELGVWLRAGDDMYDLSLTYAASCVGLITNGFAVNWLNLKYNDLSKDYWLNDVNDLLTFDDAIYLAVGEMSITTLLNTYAMFYNRSEGNKILNEDDETLTDTIFNAIRNEEWTMDYFISIVNDIYTDMDDVMGPSAGDFYGFSAEALTNLDIWQFAFDIPMIVQDETAGLRSVFNSEKTATMVDKLNDLYWETKGSYISGQCTNAFIQGNVVFHTTWLERCFKDLPDMEENYTILPYPMYDENQEKYLSGVMDNYNVLSVPYTCTNLDMVSVITEALNYESKTRLYPVYYEKSLQSQYNRDPETVEMLDIVMTGRTFDIGTIFGPFLGHMGAMVRTVVGYKNRDFSKYYDSQIEIINSGIEDIMEQYNLNKIVGKE